jgi:hypothetical protein
MTDDELFDEMRTRSFPGFDDDFSDIIDPAAAAASASAAQPSASSPANSSVGWFLDEDVEEIYRSLLLSIKPQGLVEQSRSQLIDPEAVSDAFAGLLNVIFRYLMFLQIYFSCALFCYSRNQKLFKFYEKFKQALTLHTQLPQNLHPTSAFHFHHLPLSTWLCSSHHVIIMRCSPVLLCFRIYHLASIFSKRL